MYIPWWFRIDDETEILRIIRENPFATLISQIDGEPFATHLPILADPEQPRVLIGHLATQNPHEGSFGDGQTNLAIFSGPHAYVSPNMYATSPNVPTWNYVVVHAYGKIEPIDDPEGAIHCLQQLVDAFDPNLRSTQPESSDPEFWRKKLPGIRAFEFHVDRFEAKAKASQNRSEQDRDAVIAQLLDSPNEELVRLGQSMKRIAETSA